MNPRPQRTRAHARSTISGLRYVLAGLLVIIAAAAACGGVLAYWTDRVLLDTATFMETIEPVVDDDGVRARAAEAVSDAITDVIDIRGLAGSILPGTELPVVERLASGFDSFVGSTVGAAISTDTFANLWLGEIRRWHIKLVGVVRATDEDTIAEGAVLRVTLGPYVDLLAEQADNAIVRSIITVLLPDSVRRCG